MYLAKTHQTETPMQKSLADCIKKPNALYRSCSNCGSKNKCNVQDVLVNAVLWFFVCTTAALKLAATTITTPTDAIVRHHDIIKECETE